MRTQNLIMKQCYITTFQDAVMVANSRCDVSEHEYVLASKIVCHTRKPLTGTGQPVNVIVKLKDNLNYTAISDQSFTFVNPSVTSFSPHRGPISGGTDITIIGHNLDSGSQFAVKIGNIPCTVKERTEKKVVCRTQAADSASSKTEPVVLSADGTQLKVDSVHFQYM
jgi:plexin A